MYLHRTPDMPNSMRRPDFALRATPTSGLNKSCFIQPSQRTQRRKQSWSLLCRVHVGRGHAPTSNFQAFNDGCDHYNLQPTAYFWEKVVQIYDMMVVRHGFMIVGLPFSGKTMAWKVLAFALGLLHTR